MKDYSAHLQTNCGQRAFTTCDVAQYYRPTAPSWAAQWACGSSQLESDQQSSQLHLHKVPKRSSLVVRRPGDTLVRVDQHPRRRPPGPRNGLVGHCRRSLTNNHHHCLTPVLTCTQCNLVTLGRRLPLQPSSVGNKSLMWSYHITRTPGCSTPKVDNQHSLG